MQTASYSIEGKSFMKTASNLHKQQVNLQIENNLKF